LHLQKGYSINVLLLLFFQKKAKIFAGREDRFKVIDLAITTYLLSELTGNSITEGNLAQICLQWSEGDAVK
jgi:hypothetical protein